MLSKELLTPFLKGLGKVLQTLATGLKTIPSKALLNAKVALLNFSEQSFISDGLFFLSIKSPSVPACMLDVNARVVINIVAKSFLRQY